MKVEWDATQVLLPEVLVELQMTGFMLRAIINISSLVSPKRIPREATFPKMLKVRIVNIEMNGGQDGVLCSGLIQERGLLCKLRICS
jgi:hypothetical protein